MTDPVPSPTPFNIAVGAATRLQAGERSQTPRIGRELPAAAGVTISGLDLARPLSPEVRDLIGAAFLEHHVVVFLEQPLACEQKYAFTANFGEMETDLG